MMLSQGRFGRALRAAARLILPVALGLVLAACVEEPAPGPTPESTPTHAAPATATPLPTPTSTPEPELGLAGDIVLWHSWNGEDLKILRSMLDRLQSDHPDLYLDAVHVGPSEVRQRLLDAILAGNGPSLLLAPISRYPDLASEDLVQPLNGYMDLVQEADLLSSAWYGNTIASSLVALPAWVETVALYVNTDLIAPNEVPRTLDDLLVQANLSDTPLLGLYISPFHLGWGFPAYGAVMLDAGYRVVLDQQPGAEAWLTWLREANLSGGIWFSQDYAELQRAFRHGELPMIIDGSWTLDSFVPALGDSLRVLSIPDGPAGPARPFVNSESFFVIAGQSPRDTDASVMAALALIELAADSPHTTRGLPAAQRESEADSRAARELKALLEQTVPMHVGPGAKVIWDLAQIMFERALAGQEPPADLVARFALLANEQTSR
ncbi:MAG: extracellular solute-binding protein [Caldilineaceae bacterium SB0662_bin_9]|uniref:Extracellular solute-binding protein n=1 Tax=Caldilineaceae bacterium SB0662_bin_9 TaxID=2605258 RepID=A0A6B1DVC0_9CHLR|nr:extracellular solute-binding protein [Caldilineaceae bacterium SB0662_bin_9]